MRRAEVRDRLRELIDAREPGDAMPSERTLSEDLGVSRPTGRGTFTNPRKISQQLAETNGGFAVPPAEGDWISRVLEHRIEPAGARIGQRLQVSPADGVLLVSRLRIVDGAPMAIEHIRLPAALVPGITPRDFETGKLYRHLRDRYGIHPADAIQTTEPTVTDAALLFERTTRDRGGRGIEYTRSIYRGDRYRITTHLKLDDDAG